MNSIDTNLALDYKTMTAVLALGGEESLSILGAWNCMKTLAREDPEGCVRLMPGLSMDMAALAGFLRCPEALVEKTVSVFAKLRRLTVKDGLIRLPALGEKHNRNENQELCESNRPVLQKKSSGRRSKKRKRVRLFRKRRSPGQKTGAVADPSGKPAGTAETGRSLRFR